MKLSLTQNQREVWAGLILFCVLLFLMAFVHSRQVSSVPSAFKLYAYFNKADGISVGSNVRLAGIDVGKVSAMELDPFFRVKMTLSFNKKMLMPIDTAAVIETQGLMGAKYLELTPGGDDENLKFGDTLEYTQDVLLLDELLSRFLEFMHTRKGDTPVPQDLGE